MSETPEKPKGPANFTPGLTSTLLDAQIEWDSFEAFRDQVDDAIGFVSSIKVKGFDIPNLSNLSPDQAARYNQLQLSLETDLDRWPDLKNEDGEVVRLGALKIPERLKATGALVENYDIRVARALLGEDFEGFIKAGGMPSDVQRAIAYMALPAEKRVRADPKSVGSDLPAEAPTD